MDTFGRLPLECGAGGGMFLQRVVVSRLKFRALRRVTTIRLLTHCLGGGKLLVETRAPVNFLREQVFKRCLALVRGGKIDRGALPGFLMRSFRFCERGVERSSSGDRFSQVVTEFRFAPAEMFGCGGRIGPASLSRLVERSRCDTQFSDARVTRQRGLRQARRELRVPLRELVGERDRL